MITIMIGQLFFVFEEYPYRKKGVILCKQMSHGLKYNENPRNNEKLRKQGIMEAEIWHAAIINKPNDSLIYLNCFMTTLLFFNVNLK